MKTFPVLVFLLVYEVQAVLSVDGNGSPSYRSGSDLLYQCGIVVSAVAAIIIGWLLFRVRAVPTVKMEKDITVVMGDNVKLKCSASAIPPISSVSWQHTPPGGQPLQLVIDEDKYKRSELNHLVITKTEKADEGEYVCTVSNLCGKTQSATKLTVEGGGAMQIHHELFQLQHLTSTGDGPCLIGENPTVIYNINEDASQTQGAIEDSGQKIMEAVHQHVSQLQNTVVESEQRLTSCIKKLTQRRKETSVSSTLQTCLRSEIEMTSMALDQHISPENVFQATQQLQDSFHLLDTKHVLVLYGIAGSGKTTLAYELLYHARDEYTPIILSKPDQLTAINPRDKVLVFIDDIIGRSAYSGEDAHIWYKVFEAMYVLSQQGCPRFILAFRENVFEDFTYDTDVFHNKLFSDDHRVNVSRMTTLEKEALVEKYCITSGVTLYYGRSGILENKSTQFLDRTTFNKICMSQPLTGFPQSCFLFFSNKIFFEMGEEFFSQPDQSLISKVNQLRKSRDPQCRLQYAVLAYMMLVDEAVDLNTVTESAHFKQVTDALDLKSITFSKLLDCVEDDTVRSLLRVLDGEDTVVFRHQTIKEAVFISFSKHFPDDILRTSNLQLIKDFFRSKSYCRKTGEVVLTLQARFYSTLSSRLTDEILQNDKCSQCVGLQVFEDSSFAKNFVDTLLTALKGMTDANEVVKKLLLCSSEHGKHVLLYELLQECVVYDDDIYDPNTTNDVTISMTYFREEILSTAIRKGHVKAISSIVNKERTVLYRSKCGLLPIHTAIWTGIRSVCDILWREYGTETTCMPSFNDASGRRCIHYCAMRGYIDKIREIKSHGDEFVMATDARSLSALHYAAYGGQYQIFHELVGYGLSIADRTREQYSVLQILLTSLDYDERCKILPPIPQDIVKAISGDSSVLWNSDYYRALEHILDMSDADLNDLDVSIHRKHKYNVAHYSCIDDAGTVVSLLLKKRRVLFLKRNSTSLPMTWDIAAFLGRCSILKTLLESGLVPDADKPSLVQTAKKGRKQAQFVKFKDRRLLLNRHEREKVWPGCCFPFVIFGQECDYDDIDNLLR